MKSRCRTIPFFKSQVKAVWPIFTGGKILAANRAAEAGVRSAEAGLEETRQVLLADLVKYYFGVRLAEQALAVRKQALDVMTRHLDQARRLEEEGMIAKTERLHAEVACAEAGREFKSASRDLAIAQTGLGNLLNLSEPAYPSSPLFILPAMDPVESFVEEAGEDHPGLKKLHAIGDQAHQQVRAKEAKYFPEIFLFGQRELNTRDLTVLEPKWAVGVGFKVGDLFRFEETAPGPGGQKTGGVHKADGKPDQKRSRDPGPYKVRGIDESLGNLRLS